MFSLGSPRGQCWGHGVDVPASHELACRCGVWLRALVCATHQSGRAVVFGFWPVGRMAACSWAPGRARVPARSFGSPAVSAVTLPEGSISQLKCGAEGGGWGGVVCVGGAGAACPPETGRCPEGPVDLTPTCYGAVGVGATSAFSVPIGLGCSPRFVLSTSCGV